MWLVPWKRGARVAVVDLVAVGSVEIDPAAVVAGAILKRNHSDAINSK